MADSVAIRAANERLWLRSDLVAGYRSDDLRRPETLILIRHHEALSGSVLEIGCGAGRVTGYLVEVAETVLATDLSPHMLAAARERVPGANFEVMDLRQLDRLTERFDAVVATYNVIDVLGAEARAAALDAIRRLLHPGGLLVFSSHNLGAEDRIEDPLRLNFRDPLRSAAKLVRRPRWQRNRKRMKPLESRGDGYAMLNDVAHEFMCLHYYISRDRQEAQLRDHGFELIECLALDGSTVGPGDNAPQSTELHYVARAEDLAVG